MNSKVPGKRDLPAEEVDGGGRLEDFSPSSCQLDLQSIIQSIFTSENFESQVIITTSKNYSVNINILSDLAEKFESYLAAIKHLESNPR